MLLRGEILAGGAGQVCAAVRCGGVGCGGVSVVFAACGVECGAGETGEECGAVGVVERGGALRGVGYGGPETVAADWQTYLEAPAAEAQANARRTRGFGGTSNRPMGWAPPDSATRVVGGSG